MIILFLVSLIICIMMHEFGHLIAAKMCGCGVPVYSIGFGKPYLKYNFRGTEYRLSPILLGGYCNLEHELTYSRKKSAFSNLPYSKKVYITIAGCIVNIVVGLIILGIGAVWGNFDMIYFGTISIILGLTNLLPIAPCLDGGYLIFYPLCIKKLGKKKGTLRFEKLVKISFRVVMVINILSIVVLIPWFIMNWKTVWF